MVEAFGGKQNVNTTFCDLSKAFNCILYMILMDKLEVYGMNVIGLRLLRDRHQKQSTSDEARLTHGVP